MAGALYRQGEGWDKVSPATLRALAIDPGNSAALNLRAVHLIEKRELEEAEKIVAVLEPMSARDHSMVNTIGMLRLAQGDSPSAVREFKRAVELNPYEPVFQYNLALSYELSGMCADALNAWSSFMQIETDERRIVAVRQRLQKNFAAEGGRCFDADL
jgi:Flp pilus assembly protein TadD